MISNEANNKIEEAALKFCSETAERLNYSMTNSRITAEKYCYEEAAKFGYTLAKEEDAGEISELKAALTESNGLAESWKELYRKKKRELDAILKNKRVE